MILKLIHVLHRKFSKALVANIPFDRFAPTVRADILAIKQFSFSARFTGKAIDFFSISSVTKYVSRDQSENERKNCFFGESLKSS